MRPQADVDAESKLRSWCIRRGLFADSVSRGKEPPHVEVFYKGGMLAFRGPESKTPWQAAWAVIRPRPRYLGIRWVKGEQNIIENPPIWGYLQLNCAPYHALAENRNDWPLWMLWRKLHSGYGLVECGRRFDLALAKKAAERALQRELRRLDAGFGWGWTPVFARKGKTSQPVCGLQDAQADLTAATPPTSAR